FSASLNGTLNLHGVSRNLSIPARVALLGDMFRASGDFTLSQSDFGIKPVSVAGGALKLKDELKVSFEIVARKED
ncbi:MAG: YceI family protein, partial [Terracidiphilus sp.]